MTNNLFKDIFFQMSEKKIFVYVHFYIYGVLDLEI